MKLLFLTLLLVVIQSFHVNAYQCQEILSSGLNQVRRTELNINYKDRVFRNAQENTEWIDAHLESREGLYIELTASELKNLNDDIIKNVDLVTALVNLKKEMDIAAIKNFHASMGESFGEPIIYSDFKTVRYFIPMSEAQRKVYAPMLERILKKTDEDYRAKLLEEGLVRRSDLNTAWFNLGLADNSDLASVGARKASDLGVFAVNMMDSSAQSLLAKDLAEAKSLYAKLKGNKFFDYLFDDEGLFKLKFVELYRKNKTPDSLSLAVEGYFHYKMSFAAAAEFIELFKLIDIFSPSLIIAEKTKVSVKDVKHGVFSLDFIGLGAKNLIATTVGVISSNNIRQAFKRVRENERIVTEEFEKQKDLVRVVAKDFFGFKDQVNEHIFFSGDEGVILPLREVNLEQSLDFQESLLIAFGFVQLRITYMRSNEEGNLDTELVSVAESIEKRIQIVLSGKLHPDLLRQVQFNVWVHAPRRLGERRKVELILHSTQVHTEAQRALIRDTFSRIVQAIDRERSDISIRPGNHVHGRVVE